MANPVITVCTKNTWVKVATNVVTGQIIKLNNSPSVYYMTYRMTGDPVPSDLTEAVPVFTDTNFLPISATAGIDVYLYAKDNNGSVRIDI